MANFRVAQGAPESFTAKAVAAVNKGDAFKFVAGGVQAASDGETVDGFVVADASINTYAKCVRGAMKVIGRAATGVNFATGDKVYLAAGQALDTGSAGNKAVGTVVGDDPESAGWVEFDFDPEATFQHA